MPNKPKRICLTPGCNVISDGSYCPIHRAEQEQKRQRLLSLRRGTSSERGYDSRWKKLRLYKLAKDCLCERCESMGKVERAVLVHHIKPISEGGAALDLDNLMSLCEACHDWIHSSKG